MNEAHDTQNSSQKSPKSQKAKRAEFLRSVEKVARTPEGFAYFEHLLIQCGVFQSSMTGNAYTYFLEGKREIGRGVMADLGAACPDVLAKIVVKANEVPHD